MKIHVVDGTFELFRCFHAAPRAKSADGREVGATRGVLHTITALLRKPDVTHLAVAFDQMASTSRGEGRDSDGTLLRSQYLPVLDALRALNVVVWPMYRFEADDALATAAVRFKNEPDVEQVVVCTSDKDLAQVVDGARVILMNRIQKVTIDEAGVVAKWGVPPTAIPEFLGLVGDPADGLPGIPRWGAKSTGIVLTRYGTIEAIPENADDWDVVVRGAAGLAASLNERRREAYLYRNLATLRTDVPLVDTVPDLKWPGAKRQELENFVAWLGLEDYLERVPKWCD